MAPVNPVIVSAGFIAISVAVVAAIAVYESPEIRRMADDLRRRIAIAIQSVGNNHPNDEQHREQEGEPVFNRPEDAEGFMLSRGSHHADNDPGVVADEASRRRQREELMYWNRVRMEQQELRKQEAARAASESGPSSQSEPSPSPAKAWQPREALETLQRATREAAEAAGIRLPSLGGPQAAAAPPPPPPRPRPKTSFDQILRPDHSADRGAFVVNTGADVGRPSVAEDPLSGGLLRRRKPEGVRGLNAAAIYANPFADEYSIELDDHNDHEQRLTASSHGGVDAPTPAEAFSGTAYLMAPDRDETMSDIYSATEPDTSSHNHTMDAVFDPLPAIPEATIARSVHSAPQAPASSEVFFDVNDYTDGTHGSHKSHESPATLTAAEVGSQLSLRLARKPEEDREREEEERGLMPTGRDDIRAEAYSSIQAWAQNSTAGGPGFYSPLPVTPSVAMSEPSVISAGELTPTGSMSVWGDDHSVIDHADAAAQASGQASGAASAAGSAVVVQSASVAPSPPSVTVAGSDYGVLSEADDDEDAASESVMTPTSWSEVGSVVSESDAGLAHA